MELQILASFVLILLVAIACRIMAGGMDKDRIEQYVQSHGGRVLEKTWDPFGAGWWCNKSSRIYQVRYRDSDGNVHQATCKTGLFFGVYLTDDQIIQSNEPDVTGRVQARAAHDQEEGAREQVIGNLLAGLPVDPVTQQLASGPAEEEAATPPTPLSLIEENRRLKAEIERLRRRQEPPPEGNS